MRDGLLHTWEKRQGLPQLRWLELPSVPRTGAFGALAVHTTATACAHASTRFLPPLLLCLQVFGLAVAGDVPGPISRFISDPVMDPKKFDPAHARQMAAWVTAVKNAMYELPHPQAGVLLFAAEVRQLVTQGSTPACQ